MRNYKRPQKADEDARKRLTGQFQEFKIEKSNVEKSEAWDEFRQSLKEAIAMAAYLAWEAAGRPSGRDLEFWLAAERRTRIPGYDHIHRPLGCALI